MRILLDTNMLLDAIKFRVDIVDEAHRFGEPFTLSACVKELQKIANSRSKESAKAKMAVNLAAAIPLIDVEGGGDRAILSYATRHECIVATNDKNLIKTLQSKGIRVLRLRQKRYLAEE